jgi:hypothetical protein
MDFDVIYSAALEKQGLAPSLSGYMGRSTLYVSETRAPKETAPALVGTADDASRTKAYNNSERGRRLRLEANRRWRNKHKQQIADYYRTWTAKRAIQQGLFS